MKKSNEILEIVSDVGSVSLSDLTLRALIDDNERTAKALAGELDQLRLDLEELKNGGLIQIVGRPETFHSFVLGVEKLKDRIFSVGLSDAPPSEPIVCVYEFLDENSEFDSTAVEVSAAGFLHANTS